MDAAAKPIARVSLGDRVAVSNVSIGPTGLILVQLMAHGSTDPQCCPSIPQRRDYEQQNGALVLLQTAVAQIQPPRPAPTGTGGVDAAPSVAMSLAAVILGAVLVTCVAERGTTRCLVRVERY
ncbi:MAG: hypothetical protein DWI58_09300 [Chloroflexi bacterium]|nr:MAG: hypothetical protein DWI58_09300 [Chloroflexota bacterium]